jgi:hypothetical protein
MGTYYSLVMEIHGEADSVSKFSSIDWIAEAKREGLGLLTKHPDSDWQNWSHGLDRTIINAVPIFSWGSKRPYRFLESIAKDWPMLTIVVSICTENDDTIGTVALRGSEIWSSFQDSSGPIIPEVFGVPLDELIDGKLGNQVIQAIAFRHYKSVMEDLGITTFQMALPEYCR